MSPCSGLSSSALALFLTCVACGGTEGGSGGEAGRSTSQGGGSSGSSSLATGGALTSGGTSFMTETGGRATIGGAGNADVCAGRPIHCRPLCEGGSCQCDCSARRGCDTPGWVETTLPWTAFNLLEQTGAGVSLCHPAEFVFADPQPSVNQPELSSTARLRFLAYLSLDHADAVRSVDNQDKAYCHYESAQNYGVQFLQVGGWPAMEQTLTEQTPTCGACDPVPGSGLQTRAQFYVAAGSHLIVAQAVAAPTDVAPLQEVFAIVETIRVDNGETPVSTNDDLATLLQSHQTNCE
jgi:hypothetical protein